jgi:hypothetical protein
MTFEFTFQNLEHHLRAISDSGYQFVRCIDYFQKSDHFQAGKAKVCVLRVDIDESPRKAFRLLDIFNRLNIKATFFVRLHANEYNAFGFEAFRILKLIQASGHEIGYHSEIIDQAAIWDEPAEACLKRDLKVLETILDQPVWGIASHGGRTGLNNLDFWKTHSPKDFGAKYEAYSAQWGFDLFDKSFYISDSEWTRWKCYNRGSLVPNDFRTPSQHLAEAHHLLYLLVHPETYFDRHFYE